MEQNSQPSHEPMPDAKEKEALWMIYENPEKPFKWLYSAMAAKFDISEESARGLIDKMRGREWITHGLHVDLSKLGFPERYRVDLWIDPRQMKGKDGGLPEDKVELKTQKLLARYIVDRVALQDHFKRKILVEDVRLLLGGPADLTAIIRAVDNDAMLEFVTDGLRMCGAIANTATCLEKWSVKDGDV